MSEQPSRRDLMKPVQLLGLAFVAALFAGIVTLVTTGFFQRNSNVELQARIVQNALMLGLIVAGVTFIVVLVVVALLLLAVDPAQVSKTVDRPVLLPPEAAGPGAAAGGTAAAGAAAPGAPASGAAADDAAPGDAEPGSVAADDGAPGDGAPEPPASPAGPRP